MNRLYILVNLLTKEQQQLLAIKSRKQENLVNRLLVLLLENPELTEKEIQSKLKITANVFNKICSQSKDLLIEELKINVETPLDGIYVIQKLILSGEIALAQKLFTKYETEFDEKQLWLQMEYLFVEGARINYNLGDLKSSIKLNSKRELNAKRLAKHISLNSRLVTEMIHLEGFMSRKPTASYAVSIRKLKEEAFQIGHHVLIHNALHLDYMFSNRFSKSPKQVHGIILAMLENSKIFDVGMNPMSKAIIKNTYLNFLTIYTGFGNPTDYVKEVSKLIDHAGKAARANMCYAMLEYYLYEEDFIKVHEWLNELEKMDDISKFRQYKHIISAIKAFIEKDKLVFQSHFANFYSDSSHLDFPDMEVNLRILELLILLDNGNVDLLESKIGALKKYMSRNVSADRYDEERKIILLIGKKIYSSSTKIPVIPEQLSKSDYRNIVFLARQLKISFQEKA